MLPSCSRGGRAGPDGLPAVAQPHVLITLLCKVLTSQETEPKLEKANAIPVSCPIREPAGSAMENKSHPQLLQSRESQPCLQQPLTRGSSISPGARGHGRSLLALRDPRGLVGTAGASWHSGIPGAAWVPPRTSSPSATGSSLCSQLPARGLLREIHRERSCSGRTWQEASPLSGEKDTAQQSQLKIPINTSPERLCPAEQVHWSQSEHSPRTRLVLEAAGGSRDCFCQNLEPAPVVTSYKCL